jgi:hypothetical protein
MMVLGQYSVVSFDEGLNLVFPSTFCSGQQKPKSFLEIQQEQESDFTIKGTPQTTSPVVNVGGGGVTTPTSNKMKVCRTA